MKRSSSIAALDDTIDVKLGSYKHTFEDSMLVSSMMLVTIEEERRGENQWLRKQRSNSSMGSSSSSFSRSSSRGSLRGWGSSASRKSYKVDLCSLASMEDFGEKTSASNLNHHHPMPKIRRTESASLSLQKSSGPSCNGASLSSNQALESWGFFLP